MEGQKNFIAKAMGLQENQIEFVEIYTDVARETNQLLLDFEVLPAR